AWRPPETAVGPHPVKFKLSAEGAERTVQLTARVTRPAITLPVTRSAGQDARPVISTDGKVAVFASPDPKRAEAGPARAPSVVTVVDLDRGTVAVQKPLLVGVTTLAADTAYVYAASADSHAVYVLNRKDLSEVKRIVTPGAATAITP